ncbi:mediator of RNA polymerase II transcription subunit 1-domain-containing protein [Chaetomium sp. MPI-SDFR-AT-0129]|nr:mediator of RNA polymerase II transcription subunit 1-domain-containing protein [Chaetomium sp. MPI-SDFR-AT-0129]
MSTPTPGKNPLSQGKTPSQPYHGAAATPSVSTPFSASAAFSPHGARSSPQQFKKSPAAGNLNRSTGPVNFDSPSAAAALGALDMNALGVSLQGLGNLGQASDDERARRLDAVLAILNRNKGLVSEAGIERLAKKLELESFWESSMGGGNTKSFIMGGSALELDVKFLDNVVQSVTMNFPGSAEIVNKHAKSGGEILLKDLQLSKGQNPLTKSMGRFAANLERLAMLDKLSLGPELNLFEAVAGIYECLCRLYDWEIQKVREDPAAVAKGDEYIEGLVLCTRSGKPSMNTRGRVGMVLDYWKTRRLQGRPTGAGVDEQTDDNQQPWSILIGCAPLREIGLNPVRISDKWIGPEVVKMPGPEDMHAGGPIIDWQEPESTFAPPPDPSKADPMQPDQSLLGPQLPNVVFHATFDPPVHIPTSLWGQIQQLGCVMEEPALFKQLAITTFDSLVFPYPAGKGPDSTESRTVSCNRKVPYVAPGQTKLSLKTHASTLYVNKSIPSRTLSDMTFSHPQQLITILPYLRQYAFLSLLLKNTFTEHTNPDNLLDPTDAQQHPPATPPTLSKTITTNQDDYNNLISPQPKPSPPSPPPPTAPTPAQEPPLNIDITLTMLPVPRLTIIFPFRNRTANVTLEIRENGHVRVESQDVLDEGNRIAPNGRQRRVEDVGGVLEVLEDVGGWVEFVRSRWA